MANSSRSRTTRCNQYKNTLLRLTASNCKINIGFLRLISSRFTALQYLDVSSNDYIGSYRSDYNFGNLRNTLVELNLNKCDIDSNYLNNIAQMKKLQILKINRTSSTASKVTYIFEDFKNLKHTLTELYMNYASINFNTMESIGLLENLNVLSIETCIFLYETPTIVRRVYNQFFKTDKKEYDLNRMKTSLRVLKASLTNLNGEVMNKIVEFENLEFLSVSKNPLLRNILANKFSLNKIEKSLLELDVSNCEALNSIYDCKLIEKLNIEFNKQVFKNMPDNIDLGAMKNSLLDLNAHNTRISNSAIENIGRCEFIERIKISMRYETRDIHFSESNKLVNGVLDLKISKLIVVENNWKELNKFKVLRSLEFVGCGIKNVESLSEIENTLTHIKFFSCYFENQDAVTNIKRLFRYTNLIM